MSFTWKALQAELSNSSYLLPEDDIKTRGIIATAVAIMERMSNSEKMREVTWKPIKCDKNVTKIPSDTVIIHSTLDGNDLVVNPVVPPVVPLVPSVRLKSVSDSGISW
jgi:hypothetical protein